jgi:hypothetical protein
MALLRRAGGEVAAEGLIAGPLALKGNSPARVFPKGDDVVIMPMPYSLERRWRQR